ncbi:MAG: DUF5606 domain-containing protein [Prevotellaceae bacterium]|jgi:hypothetical protein|nr:DUF5606 domain-containing protein [Prevotellaceae bacterium]
MLKKIVAISGKPGLFKLISKGKNMLVLESFIDGKRSPALSRDKVISLGEIIIYTTGEDMPLRDVFTRISEKEGGKAVPIDLKADGNVLRAYLQEVVPEYDQERVYATDIKKMLSWYNILANAGISTFEEETEEEKTEE